MATQVILYRNIRLEIPAASPHFSPGSRELAQDWCGWTPLWKRKGSDDYLFGEEQGQACQDKPEPG